MKALKHVLIGVVMTAMVVVPATASFAEKEHGEADIKLLKDSAAALQQSHPDLAKGLIDYANRQEMAKPEIESLKGELESFDLQKQEMVVGGVAMKIAKNTLMEVQNVRGQIMQITPSMMLLYIGRTVKCHRIKTGPQEFTVTKLRIYDNR